MTLTLTLIVNLVLAFFCYLMSLRIKRLAKWEEEIRPSIKKGPTIKDRFLIAYTACLTFIVSGIVNFVIGVIYAIVTR